VNYEIDSSDKYKVQTASEICSEVYNYALATTHAVKYEHQVGHPNMHIDWMPNPIRTTSQKGTSHNIPKNTQESFDNFGTKARMSSSGTTTTMVTANRRCSDSEMRNILPLCTEDTQMDFPDLENISEEKASEPKASTPLNPYWTQHKMPLPYRDVSPVGFLQSSVSAPNLTSASRQTHQMPPPHPQNLYHQPKPIYRGTSNQPNIEQLERSLEEKRNNG